MKICIVNSNFSMGGQQKAAISVCELLADKNNEVKVYSFYPSQPFYEIDKKLLTIDWTTKDLTFFSKFKRKILRKFINNKGNAIPAKEFSNRLNHLISYLINEKIEIVILSGGFLTSFSKEIKSRIPEIKTIVWQHSTAEVYLNNYFLEIKDEYIEGLYNSDALVCLTKHDKDIFSEYNSNTFVIPNTLTINSNNSDSLTNNNRLLFVARYDIYTKGIDLLFEVLSLLPQNITIGFAGTGNKKQIKKIKDIVTEKKLQDRVFFYGALDTRELESFYRSGSIFLSTSRWEGFGLVLVEAMEFGVPVVSFDTEGAKEIIGNNTYGVLIESLDVKKMASSIMDLINNKEKMNHYKFMSKKRARDFSKSKVKDQWLKVCNELIE